MRRLLMLSLSVSVLSGCSPGFVYQRKPGPTVDGKALPVKIAVVAFEDGTRGFTREGNLIGGYVFNLARTDINGIRINTGAAFNVPSLPAVGWSKALAEDLAASGTFRSVKFLYSPAERTDEEIVVEVALTKAYYTTITDKPDEFVLHLRVRRMVDNAVVREGDAGKIGVRPRDLTKGCLYGGCVIDRIQAYLNGVMQGIFADVRRDLVLALAPHDEKKDAPAQGAPSPEEVIRSILGK